MTKGRVTCVWLDADMTGTGWNWQDWLLLMADDIWVMREHKPWAILGAYKERIRCVMLHHAPSYPHKN